MGELHVAIEFFQTYLPAALLEKMELSTLKLEKHSFVDQTYKANEADVVYSVQINHQPAYVYILCESQTNVDSTMAFRLWSYTLRLMELHLRQHPDDSLPLVYPLVVYSGEEPWDAALDIFPLFGEQESLAREWWLKPYQLIDVQRIADENLQKHAWCGLMAFALKYRETRDFAAFLETLLPWIRQLEEQKPEPGIFLGKVVLHYVLNGINAHDIDLFVKKINHHLSGQLRGDIMTLAQQFEQRGIEKGIQQGIQQGMQQGMQQGEANLLIMLLQQRFGSIPAHYEKFIRKADADTLLLLGKRILQARNLSDLFEGIA